MHPCDVTWHSTVWPLLEDHGRPPLSRHTTTALGVSDPRPSRHVNPREQRREQRRLRKTMAVHPSRPTYERDPHGSRDEIAT
mmetsp:Transcript_13567/g.25412  ORF Transcript_13567/g.25412 Transcript_13567/m.25412 type:complete len:82 (-) Transcript_13567:618-863(-)